MSLEQQALHSLKWSLFGEVFSKAISPLTLIILARILLPEDFGVVAAATIVISFSQVFWDAGLAKTLIQRKERVEDSATIVFWVNLTVGIFLFIVLQLTADHIAHFFHDPRIGNVVRVLAIQLPLSAIGSVFVALKQRNFQYKQLFWVRIVTNTIPILATVPLALYGAGYWALVAGALSGQVFQSGMLWKVASWRPQCWFEVALARELFHFGRWVMLSALLGWFFLWMDALIVGGFLGTHDLGLYRTGNAMVTLVFSLIVGPLIPVLYSLFTRIGNDISRLRTHVLLIEHAVMIIVIPVGIGLLVLKNIIPELIFTDKWQGIGEIIGVIGITQAISYTVSVKQEVYRSIGKPAIETNIMAVSLLIRLPFYLVSIQYGIMTFVWARFFATLLGVINHLYFARRTIQIRFRDYFKPLTKVLIAGMCMFFVGRFSVSFLGTDLGLVFRTFIVVCISAISYGVMIYILDASFIKKVFLLLRGQYPFVIGEKVEPKH